MKQPVTITNPKGQVKELSNVEFYGLLTQFFKTKTFRTWSDRRNIAGEIKINGEMKMSPTAVEMFLRESGYKIEKAEVKFKNEK